MKLKLTFACMHDEVVNGTRGLLFNERDPAPGTQLKRSRQSVESKKKATIHCHSIETRLQCIHMERLLFGVYTIYFESKLT